MGSLEDLAPERLRELLTDLAKRWLAHDGLWFQAVEGAYGLDRAIALDARAWERFTVIEAERIKRFLGLPERGGLDALDRALRFRLYALINDQVIDRPDHRTLVFTMKACRVQEARRRRGLPDFPCKPVGLVEYAGFARTIDDRIHAACLTCPPDEHPTEHWCAWRFTID
ncbi:MAG TPA: DUF6125 family protein [Bacillota bacterium]|jgi:hypothetical protein